MNRIVYDAGGTAVGTVLTLAFLPALYAIWFRVGHLERNHTRHQQADDLRFAASQPTGAFVPVKDQSLLCRLPGQSASIHCCKLAIPLVVDWMEKVSDEEYKG